MRRIEGRVRRMEIKRGVLKKRGAAFVMTLEGETTAEACNRLGINPGDYTAMLVIHGSPRAGIFRNGD